MEQSCNECAEPVFARGLCQKHYMRWYRKEQRKKHTDDTLGRKRTLSKIDMLEEIIADLEFDNRISLTERAGYVKMMARILREKADEKDAAAEEMLEEAAARVIDGDESTHALPPLSPQHIIEATETSDTKMPPASATSSHAPEAPGTSCAEKSAPAPAIWPTPVIREGKLTEEPPYGTPRKPRRMNVKFDPNMVGPTPSLIDDRHLTKRGEFALLKELRAKHGGRKKRMAKAFTTGS